MIPEPGQLVEVRRRRWVVGDVQASSPDGAAVSHLTRLTSVDEDSAREEIEVVWELEPGGRVIERAGLPDVTAWDAAEDLDAFLDAVRWGAATNADRKVLQAPFRSGASIEDYQLDPVARAVDMARVNLLIADDTGLGKTIETGLVVQEMILRHRARTVLVVCPSSLQVKWQTEMREKFGLEFRIVDTEYVRDLRRKRGIHANPWTSFPRLITSVDWAKYGEAMRWLSDTLPDRPTLPRKFDILIVDEAHNVAPSGTGRYATDSLRTRLIRKLTPHFEHRLFLSATPHNGYPESFTALLELLDDQRFSRTMEPDPLQLQRVMVRRLKSDLVDADGKRIYPERKLMALDVPYTDEERAVHRDLAEYARSRIEFVKGTGSEYAVHFVLKLLKKRLFSSPRAFAKTLAVHRANLGQRKERGRDDLEEGILRRAMLRAEEDYADDREVEEAVEEAAASASTVTAPATPAQEGLLRRMAAWADSAKNRPDSKAEAILRWLEERLRPDGGWNDERVILFTEYRDTHAWLKEILVSHGFGGERVMELHGGLLPEERETVKAAFQADPAVSPVRILLATDAASEGIDLQNWCNCLIHVEIPWNPNVMEQRNGRIDRHGQKRDEVLVWHPVGRPAQGTNEVDDTEFLFRAAKKVESIRQDLGSVGPVLARRIERAMLGERTSLNTDDAESIGQRKKGSLAFERGLREKVAALHERLLASRREFGLTPDRVERAVSLALSLEGHPPLTPAAGQAGVFEVPTLGGAWGRASTGLEHPFTRVRRPVTFDHEVAKGRDDVVLAHLEHDLVQLALRLLRAEVWSLEESRKLHRVAVRVVPGLERPVAAVWSRLLITGGDHRRLHEELTLSGGELRDDKFERLPITRLRDLMGQSRPAAPQARAFETLAARFGKHSRAVQDAVQARSTDRLQSLRNTLAIRARQELEDITGVLNDLEQALKAELERGEPEMPRLLSLPEEEQIRRDRQALADRLKRIPEERERETAAVEARHADPTERTFPVGVVFLVPDNMIGETK
ncbi:DISARM system SNF2-like helicase DrmD [Deinococcus sp. 6GRE01]|uniref:DISARM system SNF2-like helicase DrmD n=1 Tax=Deinococcus sp. 6GRE01 TaxID=2745873 RepID=UPI001E416D8B|nr:DISARM system SNF2-like helicase DrmD [Deinococcus sp. 6GRE01]MCD0155789.1 DEAD/DEAH box helicase [Deinococcus sp. 6GRE01]